MLSRILYNCRCHCNDIVIIDGNQSYTFGDLDSRSEKIGSNLVPQDYEIPIPIMIPKSFDFVAAILACWKCGYAFVPLDMKAPSEKNQNLLDLVNSPNVINQDFLTNPKEAGTRIDPVIDPNRLAYVMFTSGSTGTPKGVMIEHHSLDYYTQICEDLFRPTKDDILLSTTSVTFDPINHDYIHSLCFLSTMVICPIDNIPNRHYTIANTTPTLLLTIDREIVKNLRLMIIAGEKMMPNHIPSDYKGTIINAYGPTEITINCTFKTITSRDAINIGKPYGEIKTYLLDEHLEPTTQGILYVGGPGLARGYYKRPDLTEKSFINHPRYGRLYRTGDVCRLEPNGDYQYLGRGDNQIKINGVRTELEEIELTLLKDPTLKGCIVVYVDKILYAFYSGRRSFSDEDYQKYLPEAIIPRYFFHVERFPTTISGKTNRRALIEEIPKHLEEYRNKDDTTPPETSLEMMLHTYLTYLLGIPQIGIHQNLLRLGLDSLKVISLMGFIRKRINPSASTKIIYQAKTIHNIADQISQTSTYVPKESGNCVIELIKSLPSLIMRFGYKIFFIVLYAMCLVYHPWLSLVYYVLETMIVKYTKPNFFHMSGESKLRCPFEFDPTKKYLFCFHPHGLIESDDIGLVNFLYSKGMHPVRLITEHNYNFPIMRLIYHSLLGCVKADRDAYKKYQHLIVAPGEFSEMFLSGELETIVLSSKQGIFYQAKKNGFTMIPVYTLNRSTQFTVYSHFYQLRRKIYKRFRQIAIIPYYGKYYLPIPYHNNLPTYFGSPIETENKAEEDIYTEYCESIRKLVPSVQIL